MDTLTKITALLDSLEIKYALTEHAPVTTSEEAAQVRGTHTGTGAKAMVIKIAQHPNPITYQPPNPYPSPYYLLVLPGNKKIDWKKIKTLLNTKDVSLISEEELKTVTGIERGGVPPFGNVLNLKTIFDTGIEKIGAVNFNAGSRTHTISMDSKDLVKAVSPQLVADITKE